MSERALHIVVTGTVQGVGFRPHVVRIAHATRCRGTVTNTALGVAIDVTGSDLALDAFVGFLSRAFPPARVDEVVSTEIAPFVAADFTIGCATHDDASLPSLAPDLAPCTACLSEVFATSGRRARYPFTSCAACGPRASVARALPWERASTTMAAFTMCAACAREYSDVSDRRFRAETIACPACGPTLALVTSASAPSLTGDDALLAASEALASGRIVATKGVGGFQLLADATRDDVIARLRQKKQRPTKPFALLVSTLDDARALALLDEPAARALTDGTAPIVLAPHTNAHMAARIAPLRRDVGVMLPSSPLSALLARALARPLVVTSANKSGMPIPFHDAALDHTLADLVLTHDRAIARPLDDGIVKVTGDRARAVRLGRGQVPRALPLPSSSADGGLALGCHEHTAPALALSGRALLGAHTGDLDSHAARDRLADVARDLEHLSRTKAHTVVADLHEGAGAHDVARARRRPVLTVPHHVAHAAALLAEHELSRALVCTFDGTGLGADGTLWGGDVMLFDDGRVRRVARLLPFPLVGGDHAVRDVRRLALSAAFVAGGSALAHRASRLFAHPFDDDTARALTAVVARDARPHAASIGRLFDAFAALLGFGALSADEGAAACFVEDLAHALPHASHPSLGLFEICGSDDDAPLVVDWRGFLARAIACLEENSADATRASAARALHMALADAVARLAARFPEIPLGLTGGCAVNRLLVDDIARLVSPRALLLPEKAPSGDGGLAYGQLAAFAASWRL